MLEDAGWRVDATNPAHATLVLMLLSLLHQEKFDYATAVDLYGVVAARLQATAAAAIAASEAVAGAGEAARGSSTAGAGAGAAAGVGAVGDVPRIALPGGTEFKACLPSAAEVLCRQACCLFRTGQYVAARDAMTEWLPALTAVLGEAHPLCAVVTADLGKVHAVLNREKRQSWNAMAGSQLLSQVRGCIRPRRFRAFRGQLWL